MWDEIKKNTEINLDLFLEILEFCIDASFFVFRGKFFHQLSGTAMGCPLSPILADIVMNNIITKAAQAAGIPTHHIRKYVDDRFVLIHRDRVQEVLDIFNLQDENIRFTCKVEENGRLPYLDILLIRTDDGRIQTDWYAKPMASGRMLNYFSFHPMAQKIGVVFNFIDRVRTLSTFRTEDEKKQIITKILLSNNYPLRLINRMLRHGRPPEITETTSKPDCYRSLVHILGLTPMIKRTLKINMPSVGMLAAAITQSGKSNAVYRIACIDCEKCFIGMTKNQLRTRMYGHQSLVNTLDRHLSTGHEYSDPLIQQLREKSALFEHAIDQQHRFDINNPSIVDTSFKTQALPVLEMCHIYTTPDTVNRRTDTDGISATYSYLLISVANLRVERPTATQSAPERHQRSI
ncbi:uncharacterized protein LOC129719840 [Wyeomyia smithii]|uniref:uncharacterized protein LOC129719840 n=1 Tax=Wyeomyia smithii TaxID=174621 RepID=UPI002467CE70|nr:uncharacterized protein LOC129719840 [Wyeomyia smithii]